MKNSFLILVLLIAFITTHGQQPTTPPPPPLPAKHADPDAAIVVDGTDTTTSKNDKIFTAVEHEPEYPGGMMKFYQYIHENLKYPEKAKNSGIEGRVILGFIVEKDGSFSDIVINRGLSRECDAEAVRLLKSTEKWNPGVQNGHLVRVMYNVIITFKTPE
ncbi:energy transducer TonB [Mucilaginibacter ginsenosidivorans]|nr:energy transducer TonB [Mucilaginibacter ginsenosidivorans]